MSQKPSVEIVGVVLAGGRSQRMGGREKALLDLAGRPMLAHVIERLAPQVSRLAINANGDPARFAAFGRPVIADQTADYPGPLAGILAGLRWASAVAPRSAFLATVSSDAPFIPLDLVARLADASAGGDIIAAQSRGAVHPVVALWPLGIALRLERALATGQRGVQRWAEMEGMRRVDFAPTSVEGHTIDPFFNVNTPEELAEAETLMQLIERHEELG